jgi:hypothetical protein
MQQWHRPSVEVANAEQLRFRNGRPIEVTQWATPIEQEQRIKANLGLYVQDQWTVRRLTLNLGLRFDYLNGYVPAQRLPAGRFVPARDFEAVYDVPNWTDLSPRLGAAYDLFGDGRTAIKWSLGRFVLGYGPNFAQPANPVTASVTNARRTWDDANGDFVPQEAELGPLSNPNFGKTIPVTRFADDVRSGFGNRPFNWEGSVGVQHELIDGVAINVGYFRRWYGNHSVLDNLLVSPEDYDEYCFKAPIHSNLPGGGGQEICGLFDIDPTKRAEDNVLALASDYGDVTESWQGVDLTMSARFSNGSSLTGGVSAGQTVFNYCDVQGKVDNPVGGSLPAFGAVIGAVAGGAFSSDPTVPFGSPALLYCDQKTPFLAQAKLAGVYLLPWDIQLSGSVHSNPGPEISANYAASNAEIRDSLGRSLAAGATTQIALIEPGTEYGERMLQVDFRLAKRIQVGGARLQGMVDFFNLFNDNSVLTQNNTFGPEWLRPTRILDGRLVKIGFQVDF